MPTSNRRAKLSSFRRPAGAAGASASAGKRLSPGQTSPPCWGLPDCDVTVAVLPLPSCRHRYTAPPGYHPLRTPRAALSEPAVAHSRRPSVPAPDRLRSSRRSSRVPLQTPGRHQLRNPTSFAPPPPLPPFPDGSPRSSATVMTPFGAIASVTARSAQLRGVPPAPLSLPTNSPRCTTS